MEVLKKIPFFDIYDKDGYCELDIFEETILIYENFNKYNKNMVIVKNNLFSATKLYEELSMYIDKDHLFLYGFDESMIVETLAASPELSISRLEALSSSVSDQPKIIITHALGVVKPIISKEDYLNNIQTLKVDQEISINDLTDYLINNGFNKVSKVTFPYEFAIRGGIIDIYGISNEMPVRIDTFDDIIETIKLFDVTNQRSRISLDSYTIFPATIYNQAETNTIFNQLLEGVNNEEFEDELVTLRELNKELFLSRYYNILENKSSIIDYIDNPILVTSSLSLIKETIELLNQQSYDYLEELASENKAVVIPELFLNEDDYLDGAIDIQTYRSQLNQKSLDLFPIQEIIHLEDLQSRLNEHIKENVIVYISLPKQHDYTIITEFLDDHQLDYSSQADIVKAINITRNEHVRGFYNKEYQVILYTEKEIFKVSKKKKRIANKFSNAVDIVNFDELKLDDYVVHNYHGIGQYKGLIQLKVDNIEKDYLHIIYKNNEKLYIPIDQFTLIKKYSSSDSAPAKLSALGGNDWKKTKLKVSKKIEDMIDELLSLYATRKQPIGYAFSHDSELLREFEDDFEYELTPDQSKAIEDVKKDMESEYVMDRLICGDVGYGKTEVAIRAAMKAVIDKKQVALLCPTTILARQHYHVLLERFKNYPINVVVVSRNTSAKAFKAILQDLQDHKIDIIVGTHKLLSNQIKYSDLGLLIVDEEQRFGVKDKEKIKQLKNEIDVLTLSATPIPRTLQMSLSGLRPMSLLQTPPLNRVPVQTYVVEKNKYLIKEAIERELLRNGQVFYLYNKTIDIDIVALNIKEMFKDYDVRVGVIHGKMSKVEIDKTMEMFDANDYDILVTTTIIETGIDIPNANTIIIEDANKFGLAQLYQIKGRVGRSDRVAYAYMLYEKGRVLNEDAIKRLQAIKELTKLGSGYKIALRDLAIRGAGDILGKSQAGNIESVGYDLYLEMLQEEIEKRQNKYVEKHQIEAINIKNTGYIPSSFELDENNKIALYKKIYGIESYDAFESVESEIRDIYGKLPVSVSDIIEKRKFEVLLDQLKFIKALDDAHKLTLQLHVDVKDKALLKEIYDVLDQYSMLFHVETKFARLNISINKVSNYLTSLNELLLDFTKLFEDKTYGN